ncbi:Peptidyl-prolyl cis-trans isomerase PpiD [Acidisarcina polymorpha]|uniref:Periplasmic chaperone PpiD n=1 Tax=Acidisarcina polymorpha TaxID=2211140 RepID=A0A2Z5G6V3_9BACT|nr:peptidyl-prolyl cis-trans isomerase [Acidisarcina polymorpha]AXC15003.1 Peptidyl-prolyl cis-trans isomerase PpiD [Acidisarcina polymorpha]
MIRFLQKDNRLVKSIFVVIIAVACITMVITLVPGIFNDSASAADTYATVRERGWLSKYVGSSTDISSTDVQQIAAQMLQRQKLPDFVLPYMMQRVGQSMIQQAVVLQEANRLGLRVTDEGLRQFLHSGMYGQVLFPKGQYIGDDKYRELISQQFNISTQKFETEVKKEIEENRLRSMVTGGITVSDAEVRDYYIEQGTKIKFDYAVISSTDLEKQINPSEAELQTFFKTNAAKYATAVPEARKITYIAFADGQEPGGAPQVTDAEVQQYYNQHLKEYQVDEQVKVRHILIKVDSGADAKTDAAAKAKAEDLLKQIKGGANFADLAKKNSDDPGSKDEGGELGFLKRGATVPEFDQAAFSLQPGQLSNVIKTKYGYHILQVEEKQTAHTRPLDEVKSTIVALLTRQKEGAQEQAYAQQLANEAQKNGLAKTAEAHHLQVVTTDYIQQGAIVPGLADGSKMLTSAFTAKPGTAPQIASTGEGIAVFQVNDVKAAHAPNFDEFKSTLLTDYRQQQLPQLLARKTSELADKARAENNDLAKAAKELGIPVKTSDLVGRTGQVPDIGQLSSVAPGLFDLNSGQISNPINTGRTGIIARLVDKQLPTPEDITKNMDQTREKLLDQRRSEMFEVFVTTLVDQYQKQGRIRVNQKAQSALSPGAAS